MYRDHCERLKAGEYCLRVPELERLQQQQKRALEFVSAAIQSAQRSQQLQQQQQQQQQQHQHQQQQQSQSQQQPQRQPPFGQLHPGSSEAAQNLHLPASGAANSAQSALSREAMMIQNRLSVSDLKPPPAKRIRTAMGAVANNSGDSPRSLASPTSNTGGVDAASSPKSPGKGRPRAVPKARVVSRKGKAPASSPKTIADSTGAVTAESSRQASRTVSETESLKRKREMEEAEREAQQDPITFVERSFEEFNNANGGASSSSSCSPNLAHKFLQRDLAGIFEKDSFSPDIAPVVREAPTSLTFFNGGSSPPPTSASAPSPSSAATKAPSAPPPPQDLDYSQFIDTELAGFNEPDDSSDRTAVPPTPGLDVSSGSETTPSSDGGGGEAIAESKAKDVGFGSYVEEERLDARPFITDSDDMLWFDWDGDKPMPAGHWHFYSSSPVP
jgi:hypothetical protein